MYKNKLKEKMQRGELLTGCMVQGAFPALVVICGLAGFDFVFLDAEHGALSARDCEELVRAAEVRSAVPLVRVPNAAADTILRYLDVGAMGIILPGVSTKEDAEQAVRAAKYHPQGQRGLNAVRASDYGMTQSLADYVKEANRETIVLAIIENGHALENLPKILAVDGLDGVILGTADLSQSLGVPGQGQHPSVRAAYETFVAEGLKSGKTIGTVVRAGECAADYRAAGVSMLISSAYSLFGTAAKRFVTEAKER